MKKVKVYILEQESYYISHDAFTEKDATHYIQYQLEWKKTYEIKHWKLEDLVWEYPYWEEKLIVRLYEREVAL